MGLIEPERAGERHRARERMRKIKNQRDMEAKSFRNTQRRALMGSES